MGLLSVKFFKDGGCLGEWGLSIGLIAAAVEQGGWGRASPGSFFRIHTGKGACLWAVCFLQQAAELDLWLHKVVLGRDN